jgi:hypothetical protein
MGPNRPHFTLSLAEAMDNRSEKAVVGNAVRFAKAIPNLVRTNTNALSSPQIITTPKSVKHHQNHSWVSKINEEMVHY